MRPPARRSVLTALAVAVALVVLPADLPAGAKSARPAGRVAHDYTRTAGLSGPRFSVRREVIEVPMADGVKLYVEVVRPDAPGRWPVILEASPYHGTLSDRDGTRILPDPRNEDGTQAGLTGYFAPRGYAVVMVDLRGTGRSAGCLDHLGPADARDLKAIVEWAAAQHWSNGRVGMVGHSYVGATTIVAAAQRPRGLVTIVPSAGLASMYDHQFQGGVPYWLQWVGPMFAYEDLAVQRSVPRTPIPNPVFGGRFGYGDNVGRNPHETGCGAPSSSLVSGEAQLSGQYVDWHRARDWSAGAAAAPIPMFLVHGVTDEAARIPAADWFMRRDGRAGDKVWIGQWGHGFGCCPNRRGAQWTAALHAWFDRHLQQRRVDTGPPVELFLADGSFTALRNGARTEVALPPTWPPPARRLTFATETGGHLRAAPPATSGSVTWAGSATTPGPSFATAPFDRDVVLAGMPELDLVASVTSPRVHLIATLYDDAPDGDRRRISQFAINPELREGVKTRTTVVPGQLYLMRPPAFAMATHIRRGHRLVLRFTTTDEDKVPTFPNDPRITVFTGRSATALTVPVAEPRLVSDTVPITVSRGA